MSEASFCGWDPQRPVPRASARGTGRVSERQARQERAATALRRQAERWHLRRGKRWGQNPDGLELRPELVGRTEQHGLDPEFAGRFEVLVGVVDHQRRIRCQAETVEQSSEDGGLWLRHSLRTGDDGAVEPTEKRKSFETERV